MNNGWQNVSPGEVLRPASRPEAVDSTKTYRMLGAPQYALGLYVTETLDALKALQTQTAAELDALLPSILDRAFKGEL